jgi:hypothetical protein
MKNPNAYLKEWGKHLRESLAPPNAPAPGSKIQRLLDELEKRETRAADAAPAVAALPVNGGQT